MPRRYANRKLKRRNKQRGKKLFSPVGNTNKLYHNPIPRTLQLATRRNNSQMLRFVKNMTFRIVPQAFEENIFLTLRANSLYDIMSNNGGQNQPGTWQPQDNDYGVGVQFVQADGWDEWSPRFQHFTVLGSKCQVTYEPTDSGYLNNQQQIAPATLYVNLAGLPNAITPTTAMKDVAKLPYTKRASIMPTWSNTGGKRLFQFYSTKKYEGVKDVMDNQNLRGRLQGPASVPTETSYFNVGIVPTITNNLGTQGQKISGGVMRIKLEYIAKLTEPSLTNQVSA